MDVTSTPIPVVRSLKKLGKDLQDARKRHRIPLQLAAERAEISSSTLNKIEKGEEEVSVGAYVKIFFILGMLHRFTELADPKFDQLVSIGKLLNVANHVLQKATL